MQVNCGLKLISINLIFFPTMAYGLVPDDITIWSDPNWAVAGGGKVSIYVTVDNATLGGASEGCEGGQQDEWGASPSLIMACGNIQIS
jgi:hypothetical protein